MELWELSARESIRDVVARYNANGDTGRFAEVFELFATDAVMEIPAGTYTGIDEIKTIFTGTQQRVKSLDPAKAGGGPAKIYMRHHTSTLQIDVIDETHAKSRCYYQVLMHHGVDHWGRYIDEFEVRDGRWVFTSRKVTLDGYVPGGMGEAGAGAEG